MAAAFHVAGIILSGIVTYIGAVAACQQIGAAITTFVAEVRGDRDA